YRRLGGSCTDSSGTQEHGGATAQLLRAFSKTEAAISTSEASDLLKTATEAAETMGREGGGGEKLNETETWGAFCIACVLLVTQKHRKLHPLPSKCHQRRCAEKSGGSGARNTCKYDVFLGGSCNPTSWRKDIVIPRLLKEGISFYNPQVDHWSPELIDIEEEAKQAASTLLYVIDDQTRAVSSMVEVANFVGSGRDVLVVVSDIQGESPVISGDVLTPREVKDLNRGREFVRTVSETAGNLVESSVHRAVSSLLDPSSWGQSVSEVDTSTSSSDTCCGKPLGDTLTQRLRLLRQVHTMYDTDRRGQLTEHETERALEAVECSQEMVHAVLSEAPQWSLGKRDRITFEVFVVLYAEAWYWSVVGGVGERGRSLVDRTSSYLRGGLQKLTGWLWMSSPSSLPPPLTPSLRPHPTSCDVYLGGSCGATSWRADDVIPILRQYGVTFFNPQIADWNVSLIPVEQRAREQCSVLLYVIGGDTLSVGSMAEVAYYIGQERKMALVLSDIPTSPHLTTPERDLQLSERAVRDYNRGRAYLANMAHKKHVHLYSNSADAALCAVYLVKGFEIPTTQNSIPLWGTSV
ncbi:hypothetical protein GBAR_LOCUS21707, partial [Geodia barretti]